MSAFDIKNLVISRGTGWTSDSKVFPVKFLVIVDTSRLNRSTSTLCLPLRLERKRPRSVETFEAVGLRTGATSLLVIEVCLPPGDYVISPGIPPDKQSCFRLTLDSAFPLFYCPHEGATPSHTQTRHLHLSLDGGLFAVRETVKSACCRTLLAPARPAFTVSNDFALRIYQPLQGRLRLEVGKRPWVVSHGEYLVINPDQISSLHPDQQFPVRYRTLNVSQILLRRLRDATKFPKGLGSFGFQDGPHTLTPALSQILDLLSHPPKNQGSLSSLSMERLCDAFMLQLLHDHPNRLNSGDNQPHAALADDLRLQRAVTWLETHYASSFTMENLSRTAGASYEWLRRTFHSVFQQSPQDFLQTVRVKKARDLLKHRPDLSIEGIALEVGYHTARSLRKAFTVHAQGSPKAFR